MLRFNDELTQSQIGAQVGISQMQVSRLLAKILTHLREAVDNDQPPFPPHHQRAADTVPLGTDKPSLARARASSCSGG
jgi:hypothetical protein